MAKGEKAGQGIFGGSKYAGDFNGDGFDDILIPAPLNDVSVPNAGAAYLIFGGAPPQVGRPPDPSAIGPRQETSPN